MPASNEEFIRKAFEAGLSEEDVRKALAERNARLGGQDSSAQNGRFASLITGEKPEVTTAEALFPRSTKAAAEGAGVGRRVLSAAGDAVSGILRVPAAAGRMLDTKMGVTGTHPQSFTESLDQINRGKNAMEESSLVGKLERDPATVATALVPVGKLAQGAGWVGKSLYGGLQGLKLGTVSAATHQADNAAQGQDVSLKDAAKEVGLNAAVGAALPVVGEIAKEGGKKIINSLIRPSTRLEQFGYGSAGRAADQVGQNTAEAVFEHGVDANSLSGMAEKVAAKKAELGKGIEDVIAAGHAAGNKVDPYNVLDDVVKEIKKDPDLFRGSLAKLDDAKQEVLEELNALHAHKQIGPGQMDLAGVAKWKTRLGNMAKWDTNKSGNATQELAKMVNRKLDQAIDAAAPGIDKLNDAYQQMRSVGEALQSRLPVANRNNAIGYSTLTALLGGPKVLGAQLASKSPMVARGLYRSGRVLEAPATLRAANAASNALKGSQE